jgi:hypothetical protein
MTLVQMTDDDQARFRKMMQETVLPGWLKRAGPNVAKEWNDTVGKALGLVATQ